MLFHLAYVSSARRELGDKELLEILEKSRRNNAALGITGMLLYRGGNFLQVLEGPEEAVRALEDKIARDPRHKGMITILQEEIPEREFPEWSMGFRNLQLAAAPIPGYTEFMSMEWRESALSQEDVGKCLRLLRSFRKNNR